MFKYILLISLTLFSFSKTLSAQNYQFQKATYEIVKDSIFVEKGKTTWYIEPPIYEMTIEKKLITPFQYIQLKVTKSSKKWMAGGTRQQDARVMLATLGMPVGGPEAPPKKLKT